MLGTNGNLLEKGNDGDGDSLEEEDMKLVHAANSNNMLSAKGPKNAVSMGSGGKGGEDQKLLGVNAAAGAGHSGILSKRSFRNSSTGFNKKKADSSA